MEIRQYEIVLVNLDPTIGSEIQKTRPCVVISPDEINHNLRTIVIAPMTTKSRSYPTRVKVKHNNQTGWVVIDQIRTIDKVRIIKALGSLNTSEVAGSSCLQERDKRNLR
jgi:mRNA interferase MazF